MKNPLLVNALELLRRPGSERAVDLDVDPSLLDLVDPRVAPDSAIAVHLSCSSLSDGIVVEGTIDARFRSECRRCLMPIDGPIQAPVRELYQTTLTDPDAFPILNDQIDLGPMIRETVLLDLPEAPLCSADCKGLCPVCGADRNRTECRCVVDSRDPRWAALDAIRDRLPD